MQLQINVNPSDKASIIEAMAVLNKLCEGTIAVAPVALENGHIKPTKKKAKEADETFDLDSATDDLTKDEPEIDDVMNIAEEKPKAKAVKKISQTDVIKAFQVFAGAKSRVEAAKVLARFKVKSVKDLKDTDYEKVLKLLAV